MKEEIAVKADGIPEIVETFETDGTKISVIKPAFKIEDEINGQKILEKLEEYGRVCYKSEERITPESAAVFLKAAMSRGHFSIIEHEKVTVRVICDRGVTHEWVRHRLASYSQESTRYCNYGKLGLQYVQPFFFGKDSPDYKEWKKAITDATSHYLNLLKNGRTPQEARGVLPNSLKTEIVVTHNIREWRHFFYLRCAIGAHPQMRELAIPILKDFQKKIPCLFDDFQINEANNTAETNIIT